MLRLGTLLAARWNRKARLWTEGRQHIFRNLETALGNRDGELVWMHCASLGEFEQGRPLLESIRARYPSCRILITFFSSSGYEVQKQYTGADYVFYLPLDSPRHARRFIDLVKPSLVLWVKYDYWYYYLTTLRQRKIPVLLISGNFRKNQPFFKWYGRLHFYMLDCFQQLFVQTEESRTLLATTSLRDRITVNGDTRFDRVVTIAERFTSLPVVESFCGQHPVIVAGSTWPEDEEELDHFANTHPQYRFILAPHEIEEPHLLEVEQLFHHTTRFSRLTNPLKQNAVQENRDANTLIIDNIGMLSRLYHYATIAYVGGGFGNDGIHNVLEAAVYGKPVIFGPMYDWYVEAVELIEAGGAFTVNNALELEALLEKLLQDKAFYHNACEQARTYVLSRRGATQKIMDYIQENRLLTS